MMMGGHLPLLLKGERARGKGRGVRGGADGGRREGPKQGAQPAVINVHEAFSMF